MNDVRNAESSRRTVRASTALVLASLLLVTMSLISLLCGATFYSFDAIQRDPQAHLVVFDLRLPRTVFAILVGGGLSVVGASYQAIFKNYLASPFTLGVSAGAALLASTAMVFGFTASRYGIDVSACAVLGALASIGIIVGISRRERATNKNTLLLVGIVFSFFCSSLLTLIQYLADYAQLFRVTRWMMGGIPSVGWGDLMIGATCVCVSCVWLFRHHRALDLMLFGDDIALVKGIDVHRVTYTSFVLTSFVIGWIVAQCGVIGFVGIIVPALSRFVVGLRHRVLLPMSFLVGASLVLVCDIVGRVLIAPFEIPAGVFTAVLGGPLFIVLLMRPGSKVW